MIMSIAGTITTTDGESREFQILPEYGWQQWGNSTQKLGDTVAALEAMTDAVFDYLGEQDA